MTGYNNKVYSTFGTEVLTAEQWRDFIAQGRNKHERKIANNTTVRIEDHHNGVFIRLHQTDIIYISETGEMQLNSGGWLSVTTKERLNRYTRAGISQKNGVWYMQDGSLFYDEMVILSNGMPKVAKMPEVYEAKLKQIKKQAKQYAKDFVKALQAGEIDYPNGGDCWGCAFASKEHDAPMGEDHLKQHMREKYYVPSLLVNAGREAGYRDDQIGLMGIGGHRVFIEPERVIYRYMVKHLQRDLGRV